MKMPGIPQRVEQFTNGSSTNSNSLSANGFWSKNCGDVSYNQLQKVFDYFRFFLLFCLFVFWFKIAVGSLFCIGYCVNCDDLFGFVYWIV